MKKLFLIVIFIAMMISFYGCIFHKVKNPVSYGSVTQYNLSSRDYEILGTV